MKVVRRNPPTTTNCYQPLLEIDLDLGQSIRNSMKVRTPAADRLPKASSVLTSSQGLEENIVCEIEDHLKVSKVKTPFNYPNTVGGTPRTSFIIGAENPTLFQRLSQSNLETNANISH